MAFHGIKLETEQGDMERWVLVYEPARLKVAELRLSPYARWRDNNRLRNKLLLQYEAYYWKTMLENNLRFY